MDVSVPGLEYHQNLKFSIIKSISYSARKSYIGKFDRV